MHTSVVKRMLSIAAISGLIIGGSAVSASVQTDMTAPARPSPTYTNPPDNGAAANSSNSDNSGNNNGNNGSNYQAVYDVSPAAANAAYAEVAYENAYTNYLTTTNRARAQFHASAPYLAAQKAVNDAQAAYDAAAAPVLDDVHRDETWRALNQKVLNLQAQLKNRNQAEAEIYNLASRKLEYAAIASRIESSALQQNPQVRQASAKLDDARQAMFTLNAQFEASLANNPMIADARSTLDKARTNAAGADAYLSGALLARSDTIDADRRRYSGLITNYWSPYYSDGYFPTANGLYGVGNGYYGTNIGFVSTGR